MLRDMKAYGHLKPGQSGTLKLVEQFGDWLICVRYRYDAVTEEHVKTAEIAVARWRGTQSNRFRDRDLVAVEVSYSEKRLREELKAAGGRFHYTNATDNHRYLVADLKEEKQKSDALKWNNE
jgi:hypothetical protein